MWPFYPFLSGNSGVTPPYAKAPNGSSWPFYTGADGGGNKMPVPYQPKPMTAPSAPQLPATQQPAQLPATQDGYKLPVRSVSGDLSKIIALLPPSLRGSFLGPAAATAASVMAPTETGPETPIYIKDKSGNWVRNPDFHDTLATTPVGPEFMGTAPTDAFGSIAPTAPATPLPQANPLRAVAGPAPQAPPAAPSGGFNFFGPGFGAGDPSGSNNMGPGQMGQGSDIAQTNLLKALLAQFQGK